MASQGDGTAGQPADGGAAEPFPSLSLQLPRSIELDGCNTALTTDQQTSRAALESTVTAANTQSAIAGGESGGEVGERLHVHDLPQQVLARVDPWMLHVDISVGCLPSVAGTRPHSP
eukprot:m.40005 g.40005  ORF g.40005 m.40005 type:complete len:117 (-) comp8034_c1_seq1:930-1280(-)